MLLLGLKGQVWFGPRALFLYAAIRVCGLPLLLLLGPQGRFQCGQKALS